MDRALEIRRRTKEFLDGMSDAERDRCLQTHLAQARGPQRNAWLLRRLTATLLEARRRRRLDEEPR